MHEHNANELFKVDVAVAVNVSNRNHFLDLVRPEFALEPLADLCQLCFSEALLSLRVKDLKSFEKLLFSLCVLQLGAHQPQKLRKVNVPVTVLVDIVHNLS